MYPSYKKNIQAVDNESIKNRSVYPTIITKFSGAEAEGNVWCRLENSDEKFKKALEVLNG